MISSWTIRRSCYTEDSDGDGVRGNAFDHEDVDISFGPLSASRRFSGTADLAVLGTLVFAAGHSVFYRRHQARMYKSTVPNIEEQ